MSKTIYPTTVLRTGQEIDKHRLELQFKGDLKAWVESVAQKVKRNKENQVHLGGGESYLVEGYLLTETDRWVSQVDPEMFRCSIKFTIENFKLEKCKRI